MKKKDRKDKGSGKVNMGEKKRRTREKERHIR